MAQEHAVLVGLVVVALVVGGLRGTDLHAAAQGGEALAEPRADGCRLRGGQTGGHRVDERGDHRLEHRGHTAAVDAGADRPVSGDALARVAHRATALPAAGPGRPSCRARRRMPSLPP